jgi:hypothetical protein
MSDFFSTLNKSNLFKVIHNRDWIFTTKKRIIKTEKLV